MALAVRGERGSQQFMALASAALPAKVVLAVRGDPGQLPINLGVHVIGHVQVAIVRLDALARAI
jgi:hypothetical protein